MMYIPYESSTVVCRIGIYLKSTWNTGTPLPPKVLSSLSPMYLCQGILGPFAMHGLKVDRILMQANMYDLLLTNT